MANYQGKAAFQGIAIGKIVELKQKDKQVRRERIEDVPQELARFQEAKEKAVASLGVLYEKAVHEVGETNAAIFEVHQMIQRVIDSAHRNGIWAGICGELGADITLTEAFIEMGIDELSVLASMILPVKEKILNY